MLFIPMVSLVPYILLALVSLGEYLLCSHILPKEVIEEEYEEIVSTGNSELDEILDLGNSYIKQIHEANQNIRAEDVSRHIDHIEELTTKILKTIKEHPDYISKIRKFMSYYVPTTIKLLNAYASYEAMDVKVENVTKSMESIESSIQMIESSYEKLLDSLYENDLIDITSDIDVYEKMMGIDGFKKFDEERK